MIAFRKRCTSAFHRIIQAAGAETGAEIALLDVGPNLGAINRAVLIAADALVVPLAPDLFSLQGLRNLGPTLGRWRKEWQTRLAINPAKDLDLPRGGLEPLGYVLLQFGARDNRPVRAYDRWAQKVPETYERFVLAQATSGQVSPQSDQRCLGMLKHYRSLMPLAMEARKPVFELKPADGAIGAHTSAVHAAFDDFAALAVALLARVPDE